MNTDQPWVTVVIRAPWFSERFEAEQSDEPRTFGPRRAPYLVPVPETEFHNGIFQADATGLQLTMICYSTMTRAAWTKRYGDVRPAERRTHDRRR